MAEKKEFLREDGRTVGQIRPVKLKKNIAPASTGSVLISVGDTQVICSAGVEESIPPWMRAKNVEGGWLSAEYSLMPCSTSPRSRRESTSGKVSGRTQEIQRLIGRSLRASVDLKKLGKRTVWIDCDVLQADGGTRTASITGGWMALRLAVNRLLQQGLLTEDPIREAMASVSVGVVRGVPMLDLNYQEDCGADVDMNVVMTESGRFVEVQGSAEGDPFSEKALNAMLKLAKAGIRDLLEKQQAFLAK